VGSIGSASINFSSSGGSGFILYFDKKSDTSDFTPVADSFKLNGVSQYLSLQVVAVDTLPPFPISFSPGDESNDFNIADQIVITFNESIARGTGSIVLKTNTDTVIATYDAATSSNLTISGSTLSIATYPSLTYETDYKVDFPAGSIKDLAGNNYAGTTSYNFTTAAFTNSAPTGSVTISGTATQGQILTASNTLVDVDGLGAISYQWLADGNNIAGATASTFVLVESQVGKVITVTGSYTDGRGTAEAVTSSATVAVDVTIPGLTVTKLTLAYPGHSSGEQRNSSAFAALRSDGSVVTWGSSGGDSSAVASALNGTVDVTQVFSTGVAFAALRSDGSVVTWGDSRFGGDSSAVASALNGTLDVVQVFSTWGAFAALRSDGSVVTWGSGDSGGNYGGDSSAVVSALNGTLDVVQVFSTREAFAALRSDGSVVTWGHSNAGGDSSAMASALDGTLDVVQVFSTWEAFAALRKVSMILRQSSLKIKEDLNC
jgi:hypothetical protein